MSRTEPPQGTASLAKQDNLELYRLPGHLIRRLHQVSVAEFDAQITQSGFDLTPVQYAALTIIAAHPGLDQASLASAIAYDRVTTGGVVDRLEQKGFILREINPEDRRSRRLSLKADGAKILAAVTPLVRAVEKALLEGLSLHESDILLQLLQKTLAAVNENSRSPLKMIPPIKKPATN